MREVRSSDAKSQLSTLLDDVERGETVVITRHGRPIARLVPEAGSHGDSVSEAIDAIRQLGKKNGRIDREELLSARHEGHKY